MELVLSPVKRQFNIKKLIPYISLFIISLLGVLICFYNGYPVGDDTYFHISNIYDIYLQIKTGSLSPISSNLVNGVGYGKQLFYSPLAHYIPAVLGVMLEPLGISLLTSFKITLFLSVFISAIFMYRFSMHITKDKMMISIVVASIYTLYPYRYFDAFCRLAYAEALSFWFLPLFFMGIYDLCHIKKVESKPFVEIILGGSLLFLTHNLTAFYAFVFGIIYLLFYITNIIKIIKKDKILIIYASVSIIIMLGIMSVALVSSYTLLNSNYYNVSDPIKMWSNVDAVINRNLDAGNYSGFLNFIFLNNLGLQETTPTQLLFDIVFFVVASILFVIIDNLLKKFKYIHLISAVIIYSILIYFLTKRLEVYIAAIAFMSLYSLSSIVSGLSEDKKKIYKSLNLWYSIFMIILVVYMIARHDLWYILPKTFLNIQFPWRLWAFIPLYLSILVSEISNAIKNQKIYSSIMIIVSTLFIVLNMSYIEKRIAYERNYNEENKNSNSWTYAIDDSYFDKVSSIGACMEYMPVIYYYNSDYKPTYNKSLYYKVRNEIFTYTGKYNSRLEPVILDGMGKIESVEKKAPRFVMNITLEKDSIIQLPLIYYPGYEITVKDENSNEYIIDIKDIDSLISFELKKGSYVVKTNYVGTPLRKATIAYRTIAIYGLFIFVSIDMIYNNYIDRKKRRIIE